ncbi:hypothetical protein KP003_16670 [Geomonas nitrogeniifigens]|uniref:spike base protein, RCAP_Rcc01079 family n=1 Tax=Geomonas diazotrophica TaxID=2843197 RepID=UPI001C2BE22C|nr:hypothetical protein [Geomonas nitrogeniifigens]QXE85975.1 hypothetical protein KP003_16670 [Geomonas nitrogeniifigens]
MAATDKFGSNASGLNSPARSAFAITPHDTNEFAAVTRYVYVGGAGDVVAQLADDGAVVTFKAVPLGTLLPIRAKIITTASTATNLVGIY